MVKFKFLLILNIILFSGYLWAQDDKNFTASVQKNNISLGESMLLTLTADGFEPQSQPSVPQVDGLRVTYQGASTRGQSYMQIIVNGRQQVIQNKKSVIFQYEVIPEKTGNFVIPSIMVTGDGKTYRTQPISINVSKETENSGNDIFLEVKISDKECYVQQPLVLEIKWYINKRIEGCAFDIPFLPTFKNFLIKDIPVDGQRKQYVKVPYNNQVVDYFEVSNEMYNGMNFQVMTLRKVIIPVSSGKYSLGTVTLRCDVVNGYQQDQGDPFDDFGFGFFQSQKAVVERRVVRSQPFEIDVKPLPPAPDGYPQSVSVGNFSMDVSANPKDVKVGDPINVTAIVEGVGNIDGIADPVVTDTKDFRVFQEDAKAESKVEASGITGKKVFQIVLIPTSDRVKSVPPLKIVFFDTKTSRYQQIVSNHIPVNVSPQPEHSAPVIIDSAGKPSSKKEIQILYQDLPGYIRVNLGDVVVGNVYVYNKLWFKLLFPFLFLFNISTALYLRHLKRLKGDMTYSRKKRAYKNSDSLINKAHKALKHGDQKEYYALLIRAINEYIADKLNISSGGLTEDEVKYNLEAKKVEVNLIDRITAFYRNADMARFMPSSKTQESTAKSMDEAKSIIKSLEKLKW